MTPLEHDEISAGNDAADLLTSRAWAKAKAAFTDGLASQRRSVQLKDADMHTRLILLEQCWQQIEHWLDQCKQTGNMAQFRIADEKKRRELAIGPVRLRY